ncbi:monooxygenase [Penicillium malachiteum]|nr:monooxygenase [Penicillium malachiteum]
MTSSQVPIAIIGAGPAGLTFARLLELAKIPFVVFERDESVAWADNNSSSGTLDIHKDTGQAALEEACLLQEFHAVARDNVPTRIADAQGIVHLNIPGDGGEKKPEIDREDLRKILLGSIPAHKVRWGFNIQQVKKDIDGSMSVHAKNDHVESGFRLVVGADGAWSKVTSKPPQYSGTTFFTSYIQVDNLVYSSVASMVETGNYLALGHGCQILLHYLGDRSYHLSVGVRMPGVWDAEARTPRDPSAVLQSVTQNGTEWAQELLELINSANRSFRLWPLYTLSKSSVTWEHTPGVTLLGDAAHLTYNGSALLTMASSSIPSGTGVNAALYDALMLARHIVQYGPDDLDAAVIGYEKKMMPRALGAIEKGQWYAEHFFGADGPQAFLRAISVNSGED